MKKTTFCLTHQFFQETKFPAMTVYIRNPWIGQWWASPEPHHPRQKAGFCFLNCWIKPDNPMQSPLRQERCGFSEWWLHCEKGGWLANLSLVLLQHHHVLILWFEDIIHKYCHFSLGTFSEKKRENVGILKKQGGGSTRIPLPFFTVFNMGDPP